MDVCCALGHQVALFIMVGTSSGICVWAFGWSILGGLIFPATSYSETQASVEVGGLGPTVLSDRKAVFNISTCRKFQVTVFAFRVTMPHQTGRQSKTNSTRNKKSRKIWEEEEKIAVPRASVETCQKRAGTAGELLAKIRLWRKTFNKQYGKRNKTILVAHK